MNYLKLLLFCMTSFPILGPTFDVPNEDYYFYDIFYIIDDIIFIFQNTTYITREKSPINYIC